ncbi:unnamed protein product [marine sediment metagenome]|uniref:Molecular chaperone DnaK n=1 Tax=marine sediment metagenome TaxID=412755 RepID=X1FFE8_9ZZZZ
MSEESKPKKKEKIIGIDLGTSNSACAILSGTGQPEIIPAAEGRTLGGKAFPSYVAFDDNGRKIVGEPEPEKVKITEENGENEENNNENVKETKESEESEEINDKIVGNEDQNK